MVIRMEGFDPTAATEVMGSIDRTDPHPRFIIADVSRDGAWVSVIELEACRLREWR